MAETNENSSLVAYVPVISAAYLEYFDSHKHRQNLFVTDDSINGQLRQLRKDVRAIKPETAASLLESHLQRPVSTIGMVALKHLSTENQTIYMPNDDLSNYLIDELGIRHETILEPIFLRWNRDNIDVNSVIIADRVISAAELPDSVVLSLKENLAESNDWWRQNAAVAVNDQGDIVASARNRYLPNDYSAEIDGDIRSQLNRGSASEAYNTIHAEAELIARAAKAGISLDGCEMYATTFPCSNCAKLIMTSGVSRVIYLDGYATADGENVLRSSGVELVFTDNAASLGLRSQRLKDKSYPIN